VAVKNMLASWERDYPGRSAAIFASVQNLAPGHLADPRHFDFASLRAGAVSAMSDAPERELARRLEFIAVQVA
jgi:tRNA 2-thiocytidine biosynthesis protein TtcA